MNNIENPNRRNSTTRLMHLSMSSSHSQKKGFTLVELLTVISIMAVMAAISIPSVFSLTSSGKMNQTTSELGGILEQARQYAAAQNTYVWVTFNTQTTNNIDLLTVAVVASTDGTDPTITSSTATVPSTGLNLISKIRTFQQVQLKTAGTFPANQVASLPTTPVTGAPNALSGSDTFNVQIPGNTTTSAFTQSIEFTPSGEARNTSSPIDIIEFGLEPAVNSSIPNPLNVAVVRVNGITGQAIVYRR
jgi:prepilin-type N-terminal cleavage/methylation domain-containing protein